MSEQRFETNDAPRVAVASCGGNLVVGSWLQTAVSIQGEPYTVEQPQPGTFHLTGSGDLYLAVPHKTSLTLGTISGNLTIKHVSGGITVDDVAGKVTLRSVDAITLTHAAQAVLGDNVDGSLVIQEAGGMVTLRNVSGVQIQRALGDVALQFANGHVTLGDVGGRLEIRTVNGDVALDQARGDVVLVNLGGQVKVTAVTQSIWLVGGLANGDHRLAAGEAVYVYWPSDAPLNLTARAPQVEHRLPLENATPRLENGQMLLSGRIEEGPVYLHVQAGQRVALKPLTDAEPQFTAAEFTFPPEPAADALRQQVTTAVQTALAHLPSPPPGLEAQLAAALLDELEPPPSEPAAPATAVPAPTPSPAAPTDKDAEQRHILQLLKDGLLTVDQALLLLKALKD